MLTEFLEDIELLTVPEVKVWDETLEQMVVTQVAQYRTQTILKTRPPTESQSRLDMVIGLGKPQAVIDKFTLGVNLGNAWDYCESYITYMNELDTWNKWVAVEEFNDEGEALPLPVKPDAPIEPVRASEVVSTNYTSTLFKVERAKAMDRLTVTVGDLVFDADETSQNRMVRAITVLVGDQQVPWTLADNTVVLVTQTELKKALVFAGMAQSSMWENPHT